MTLLEMPRRIKLNEGRGSRGSLLSIISVFISIILIFYAASIKYSHKAMRDPIAETKGEVK